MPTQKKVEAVETLRRLLTESSAVFLTDYRGLKVADLGNLRRQLREADTEFHVAKNTLVRRAAAEIGITEFDGLLEGPTAAAFVRGDLAKAAKVLSDFARASRGVMTVKGGLLGQRIIDADGVTSLATLPSREVLLARLMGQMNAPIVGLVSVLGANLSGLARLLRARADQLAAA